MIDATVPDGYVEQFVYPGDGLPIAMISELEAALWQAYDTTPADITIRVQQPAQSDGGPVRITGVKVGADRVHRGQPNIDDNTGEPPTAVDVPPSPWTVQCWVWAPDPPTADELDFAVVARSWAARVVSVKVASGVIVPVTVSDAWLNSAGRWWPLPEGYPASAGRAIDVVP